jgi:hypothetical protein
LPPWKGGPPRTPTGGIIDEHFEKDAAVGACRAWRSGWRVWHGPEAGEGNPFPLVWHGHMCWWRVDPKDLAEAVLMLKALERKGRLDVTDDIEPSPEQIEEACRFMLARGYQLEEGA